MYMTTSYRDKCPFGTFTLVLQVFTSNISHCAASQLQHIVQAGSPRAVHHDTYLRDSGCTCHGRYCRHNCIVSDARYGSRMLQRAQPAAHADPVCVLPRWRSFPNIRRCSCKIREKMTGADKGYYCEVVSNISIFHGHSVDTIPTFAKVAGR